VKPANPHLARGFLDAKEFKPLKVAKIDQLSSNVFKYSFKLPDPRDVVGLPIGQHVAIKATIDGKTVTRSYTPTSNNLDAGLLELVIKIYPDGQLTGKFFANLKVGDEVLFRGPKGAYTHTVGQCKKIGMIAGGTGITPMYQLIRAICEDEYDTTEVSLILANRSEDDILLRKELETFARRYPKNFKLWYMLDNPPENWAYGSGFVTADVMKEKLPAPAPDTKIMLCGPPGMVNASKKALATLGFKAPGAVAKMSDEVFCF
jgi:cytochrome-b5 reductase